MSIAHRLNRHWRGFALAASLISVPLYAQPEAPAAPEAPEAPEAAELTDAHLKLDEARKALESAAEELARLYAESGDASPRAYAYQMLSQPDRALLGVSADHAPAVEGKSPGVLIKAVTPGGGADQAGLKSGDLILSANGESLAATEPDLKASVEKLKSVMDEVQPGEQVAVVYERNGQRSEVAVVAQKSGMEAYALALSDNLAWLEDAERQLLLAVPPLTALPPLAPGAPMPFSHGDWLGCKLELARLDKDLAAYFKTDQGVLVVRASKDGEFGLKSGDVLQSIGGEPVSDPIQAMERLHSEESGEQIDLDVIRQGRNLTLEGVVPQHSSGFVHRIEVERRLKEKGEPDPE